MSTTRVIKFHHPSPADISVVVEDWDDTQVNDLVRDMATIRFAIVSHEAQDKVEHFEDATTVQEVYTSLSDKQRDLVHYLVGEAQSATRKGFLLISIGVLAVGLAVGMIIGTVAT